MKYLCSAFLIFVNCGVLAQQNSNAGKESYFSLGLELGPGTRPGVYGQLFASLQKGTNYYKIKNSSIQEFEFFGDKPNPRVFDYECIIGKNYDVGRFHNFQLGVGLAFTGKITQGKFIESRSAENDKLGLFSYSRYEKLQKETIGLPLEVKYNFQFGRIITIGISANANINSIQSFAGLSAGIFLGNVRGF